MLKTVFSATNKPLKKGVQQNHFPSHFSELIFTFLLSCF